MNNCLALSTRTDFSGYTALLRNVTNGNFTLVTECRREVCGALWGSGNPDISGIGMAVGYVLQTVICTAIVLCFTILRFQPKFDTKLARLLLSHAAKTFYDNAIFFTFAIQLASIFTLSMANFGISTAGMGGITMKIAWLVSTLTLLPLVPCILLPDLFMNGSLVEARTKSSGEANESLNSTGQKILYDGDSDGKCTVAKIKARRGERFLLFALCWALSFYPFFSRMNGTFGTSQIGSSPDSAISTVDWGLIEEACFKGIRVISPRTETIMTAFGIAGWLLVTIIVVCKILQSATKDLFERQRKWLNHRNLTLDATTVNSFRIWLALGATILILLIVHFWAFFRLRRFQSDMNEAAGAEFPDGHWTFGQIVSVVVFFPAVVEVSFLWTKQSLYCN